MAFARDLAVKPHLEPTADAVRVLVFVLCLGVVVNGLILHGLESAMRGVLPSGDTFLALLGIATVAALLSNIVNNLPAVVVLLTAAAISDCPPADRGRERSSQRVFHRRTSRISTAHGPPDDSGLRRSIPPAAGGGFRRARPPENHRHAG